MPGQREAVFQPQTFGELVKQFCIDGRRFHRDGTNIRWRQEARGEQGRDHETWHNGSILAKV
ncbi:hypothetical protein SAMN04515673_101464 [Poseidonocella sedimentorum]|uniref:Uncharacterized protein n=1 Tax=Poseidonocella sedimentorum TaxID=871652 RepID=A0A1I6CVT2_9RHOB|nr:hypothetical protein SAMN04515673_101464 [Poseidonocella sedimentorum]